MDLRCIQQEDKALFISLAKAFYASDAVSHPIPTVHMENAFDEMINQNPYFEGLFISQGGKTVGYIIVCYTYSMEAGGKIAILDELFLLPEYRQLGLGSELLRALKKRMTSDIVVIKLEIVTENQRLQRFYEKRGYQMLGYSTMIHPILEV